MRTVVNGFPSRESQEIPFVPAIIGTVNCREYFGALLVHKIKKNRKIAKGERGGVYNEPFHGVFRAPCSRGLFLATRPFQSRARSNVIVAFNGMLLEQPCVICESVLIHLLPCTCV